MTETTKLKLLKPDIGDQYNIANFNTNADIIDAYATSNDLAVEKAKTDAISTASADATDKANTAQANAINTASQDATNKANTAKSEAISTASDYADTVANEARINPYKGYAIFLETTDENYSHCDFGRNSTKEFRARLLLYPNSEELHYFTNSEGDKGEVATVNDTANAVVQANAYTNTRLPDYSAGISLDLVNQQPVSYTAPEDGYILLDVSSFNSNYTELSVNGVMLIRGTNTSDQWGVTQNILIPVKSGDLVIAKSGWGNISLATQKLTFFPMR